ncbi:N-acetylmuramoyl-L-alanine amidase [Rudanella paleaurantiibacter]|uniref:N-acetylmuramoyl-L-alanine amidase n=1 Tax=Rudanella paleaurantiibacter TaxID=2614655 RepID=A0A7J5TRT4_9BACT|nr:N-acetylmuramoyl-L-alanine amidase [Rudanella paleaurantiibacter]KAB7725607.1 N-acetylmuramoyl-L-alanine amidase [Rudanella paleaurantiibacter]
MKTLITGLCLSLLPAFLWAQTPAVRDTLLTGFTRSELTPLYYGLGTDRLGGARMETLDSAVVLNLTGLDSSGRFWRVRLAPSLSGFVPVEQVRIDTTARYPTGGLTGNWTVSGDAILPGKALPGNDILAIRLPARLPYRGQLLADGHLIVDLFGVTSNTNWITQRESAGVIRDVWFEQVADEILRVHVTLKKPRSWGYSLVYAKNTLTMRVRRGPAKPRLRGLTVAVDAGHGGSNTGARGLETGVLEKDLTLDVARQVRDLLTRKGARVIMTRDADTNIGPTARLRAMRQLMPDLLVSIHFNASGSRAVRGMSTYYKHLGFRSLSQVMLRELLRVKTGVSGEKMPEFGNVGHFNFFFNTPTEYPNVLVEGPFLSNPADEQLIVDPRFRKRMARAIATGIRKGIR